MALSFCVCTFARINGTVLNAAKKYTAGNAVVKARGAGKSIVYENRIRKDSLVGSRAKHSKYTFPFFQKQAVDSC